jgi:hypothetical protein
MMSNKKLGSFWDRWLNDHGVVDGEKYFPPSRPLRPGFLPPMQGFKDGLCQLPDEIDLVRLCRGALL